MLCCLSCSHVDSQIISRMSLPGPVLERYMACNPPPPLNSMNQFREDDKVSLTFYTDPDFFFRKWVAEQQEMVSAPSFKATQPQLLMGGRIFLCVCVLCAWGGDNRILFCLLRWDPHAVVSARYRS